MTQIFVFIIEKINHITYYKLVMYNFRLVHNKSFTHTNSKILHLDIKMFLLLFETFTSSKIFLNVSLAGFNSAEEGQLLQGPICWPSPYSSG